MKDSSWSKLLSICFRNNIPFYIYRLPDSTKMVCGIQHSAQVQQVEQLDEVISKQGFLLCPFDTSGSHPSWFIRGDLLIEEKDLDGNIFQRLEANCFMVRGEERDVVENNREDYLKQVSQLLEALNSGKAKKAVLSRIALVEGVGRNCAPELLEALAKYYNHSFLFFVHIPGHTTWLGVSPETLLDVNSCRILTIALAGTQGVNSRREKQVIWESKEIEEQRIVGEYIESVFESLDIDNVIKKGPFTCRAGNLFHLKTEYEILGALSQEMMINLIERLHPTPAVCGMPTSDAMQLISDLEHHDREYYTGYLGPIHSDGGCSLFVNLRSMKLMEDKSALYIGGGITPDSKPEKEWEETCLKAQTLLNVIENIDFNGRINQ